ncbi:MAG TPA: hypothetical protein ENN29_02670 [Candidatus Hydrogenedentes bacterium]|nr:hypothetical protein [Candidatus Hydrogenedentota bacterium]
MSAILEFKEKPPLGKAYVNAFTPGRSKFAGLDAIPRLEATWSQATESPQKIQAYRELCGIGNDGNLPLLYPHVLTSSMHIHLITDKKFPASALGAVHARMHIMQHRPIADTQAVDIRCRISDARALKAGLETDIATTLSIGDERVWESVATYIFRGRKFGKPGEQHPWASFEELGQPTLEAQWHVPVDMGKRYAKITGDYNPIHVSRILAKLFGFKRDIVHGMWCLCRCLAHIQDFSYEPPVRLDAAFKGPVFMDSECAMKCHEIDQGYRFDLYNQGNPRPSIVSVMRHAAAGEALIQ